MNQQKWIRLWKEERDKVMKTYDVELFKKFYEKWRKRGVYQMDLPQDNIIEISMRKCVYAMDNTTKEEREEARAWLAERGYKAELPECFRG